MGNESTIRIESERAIDRVALSALLIGAFEGAAEARLVDELRRQAALTLSLVARVDGQLAGCVAFSPVTLEPNVGGLRGVGLAPLAVLGAQRKRGLGARLVEAALARARALGFDFAVVLGDPAYYGRLGFTRADTRGLACVFSAPPGAFQVLELRAGALDGARGLVRYHPAFDVFA